MSDKEAPDILAAACSAVGIDELDDIMNTMDQAESLAQTSTSSIQSGANELKQAFYPAESRPHALLEGRASTTVPSQVRPYLFSGPYPHPPNQGWDLRIHPHNGNRRNIRMPMDHPRPRYSYVPPEVKDGYVNSRVGGYVRHPHPTYINEHPRLIHNVRHKVRPPLAPHETEGHPHAVKTVDSSYPPHTLAPTSISPQRMAYPHINQPVRQHYPTYTMQSQAPSYIQPMYTNPYYPTAHSVSHPHPRLPRSQQTQTSPHLYPVPENMKGKMIFHPHHENPDNRRNQRAPELMQTHTEHNSDKMSPLTPRQIIRPPVPSHRKEIVQPPIPMYAVESKNHPQNFVHHENGVIRQYIRVPVPNNFQAPNTITRIPNPNYSFFPHYVSEGHSDPNNALRKNISHMPGGFPAQPQMTPMRHPDRIAAPVAEVPDLENPDKVTAPHSSSNQGQGTENSKHSSCQQFQHHSPSSRVFPTTSGTTASYTGPVTSYVTQTHLSQNQPQSINHFNAQDPRSHPEYFLRGEHGKKGISPQVLVSTIPKEVHYHPHNQQDKRLQNASSVRGENGQPYEITYSRANVFEKTTTPYQNAWSSNDQKSASYVACAHNAEAHTRLDSHLNPHKKRECDKLLTSNSVVAEQYGGAPCERYPQYYKPAQPGHEGSEHSTFVHAAGQFPSSKESIYNHPAGRSSDKVLISTSTVSSNNQRLPNNIASQVEKQLPKAPVNRATVLKVAEYSSNYNNQCRNNQPSSWPPINSVPQRRSDVNYYQPSNSGGHNAYDEIPQQRSLIHQPNYQSSRGTCSSAPQNFSSTPSSLPFNKDDNAIHYHDTSRTTNISWSHQDLSLSTTQAPTMVALDKTPSTPSNTADRPVSLDILKKKDGNVRRECKLSPKAIFFERMRGSAATQQQQQQETEAKNGLPLYPAQFSPFNSAKTPPQTFHEKKRKLSETDDFLIRSGTGRPDIYSNRSPPTSRDQPCSTSGLQTKIDNGSATAMRVSPDSNTDITFSPDTSLTGAERSEWRKEVSQKQRRVESPISPDTSDAYLIRTNQNANPTLDNGRKPPPPYSVACKRLEPQVIGSVDEAKYSQLEVKNSPKSVRRLSIDDNVTMEKHPFEKAACPVGTSESNTQSSFAATLYQWPSCSFVPNSAPSVTKKGRYDIKDDELFASTARAVTPPPCVPDTKSYAVGTSIHELQNIKEIPVHEERLPDDTAKTDDKNESTSHDKPQIKISASSKSPLPESPDPLNRDFLAKDESETERFIKLLRPVLTTLLSVPEAESFRPLLDEPGKLLEEMVKRGGGEPSSEVDPLLRMKKNFKLFIRQYINPETRSEWGWEDSSIDDILELLSAQAGSARDALDTTDQTSPAAEGPPEHQDSSSPRSCNQEKDEHETGARDQTVVKNESPSLASPDSRNCEQEFKLSDQANPTEPASGNDQTKATTSAENGETCRSSSPDLSAQETLTTQSKKMFHFRPGAGRFDDRTSNKDLEECSIKSENFIAGRTSNIVRSFATSTTDPLSPLSSGSASASNSSLDPAALHGGSPKTRFPTVDFSPTDITKDERADENVVQETTHIEINASVDEVSSATENCGSC